MNLSKIFCCICCLLSTGKVLGMNAGNNMPQYEVILVGDTEVGKTNIIGKFTKNIFNDYCDTTIGIEFTQQNLTVKEGATIKLKIWDAGGNFESQSFKYVKQSHAIVFVYDVSNKQSFENLNKWLENVKSVNNNPLYFLVGNKTDLRDNNNTEENKNNNENNNNKKDQVTKEEGEKLAKENNMKFFEVSAKTGDNLEILFKTITQECYEKFKNNTEKIINPTGGKKSLCKRIWEYCCCC